MEQISLFDPDTAESLLTGAAYAITTPEAWMARVEPDGQYAVDIGGYQAVLRPASGKPVPPEMKHCYYTVCGMLYSAVYLGTK